MAQTLPQVTISATRSEAQPFDVPGSVDVIDGQRWRDASRPEINLSESLAIVPGLTIRDRRNLAQDQQLSIRGFGARSTFGLRGMRLYLDGIPATMHVGQGQLSHLDLGSVSHVEVLRGPFSALHGNSSGGVLQLFTQKGEGPPVVTGGAALGSDGLARPFLRATGLAGGLGYSLSASHLDDDGLRPQSAASRAILNARLDWTTGHGQTWMLAANAAQIRAQDPLGLTRSQFDSDPHSTDAAAIAFHTRKTVRQAQLGLVHEARLNAQQTFRLMVYSGERRTRQFQAIPPAAQANALHAGGVIDLDRGYSGLDARWTYRMAPVELVAGLAYDRLVEDRRGYENFVGSTVGVQGAPRRDEVNRVRNADPYLQGVWRANDHWTVTAGLRYSDVRFASRDRYVAGRNGDDSGATRYRRASPALGLMYAATPALRAYAALGMGFETPTFNELSYRPDGQAGLNLGLRPARSRHYEMGLKGKLAPLAGWRSDWSAAVFQVDTQDELVTQTNSGGRSTFRNAGQTRRRGIELAWSARWRPAWTVQLAHTWLDARYRDAFATCRAIPCAAPDLVIPAGNRIPGIARMSTALEVNWLPASGWRGGVEVRRFSSVFVNDANTDEASPWSTAALHGGYLWRAGAWHVEAAARIDNLFDRRYAGSVIVNEGNARFFEPAPGRTYTAKLSVARTF